MRKRGIVSKSEKETMKIAREFSKTLRGGEVVLLEGELGVGKTTFVRGLARAFGIKEPIRSPTFTLMHVYEVKNKVIARSGATKQSRASKVALKFTGRVRSLALPRDDIKYLVHVDAYRLRGAADLRAIGIEEYSGKKNVLTIVEWGRRAQRVFSTRSLIIILFHHGQTTDERIIEYGVSNRSGKAAR